MYRMILFIDSHATYVLLIDAMINAQIRKKFERTYNGLSKSGRGEQLNPALKYKTCIKALSDLNPVFATARVYIYGHSFLLLLFLFVACCEMIHVL